MLIYRSIDASKGGERRIAEGLLKLKEAFEKVDIPERNLSDTLLIATWNIREFDSTKYGVRGREPSSTSQRSLIASTWWPSRKLGMTLRPE